ncbi:MAG: hypothetical protein Q8N38_05700 [Bacteroidales bacterium]|nr:hypothetical protein [Bacteroidales bacterium]
MRKFLFFLITAIYPLAFLHAQSASDHDSFISIEKGKGKFVNYCSQNGLIIYA